MTGETTLYRKLVSVAVQGSGRILTTGGASFPHSPLGESLFLGFTPSGTLDPTSGHIGFAVGGGAISFDSEGGIVTFGGTTLARYPQNGQLDIGTDGFLQVPRDSRPSAVVPDRRGGIIVVQDLEQSGSATRIAVSRFVLDGSLDAGFGEAGKVVVEFPDEPYTGLAHAARDPQGRLVAVLDKGLGLRPPLTPFRVGLGRLGLSSQCVS